MEVMLTQSPKGWASCVQRPGEGRNLLPVGGPGLRPVEGRVGVGDSLGVYGGLATSLGGTKAKPWKLLDVAPQARQRALPEPCPGRGRPLKSHLEWCHQPARVPGVSLPKLALTHGRDHLAPRTRRSPLCTLSSWGKLSHPVLRHLTCWHGFMCPTSGPASPGPAPFLSPSGMVEGTGQGWSAQGHGLVGLKSLGVCVMPATTSRTLASGCPPGRCTQWVASVPGWWGWSGEQCWEPWWSSWMGGPCLPSGSVPGVLSMGAGRRGVEGGLAAMSARRSAQCSSTLSRCDQQPWGPPTQVHGEFGGSLMGCQCLLPASGLLGWPHGSWGSGILGSPCRGPVSIAAVPCLWSS